MSMSLCDKYTIGLLKGNTAENQMTLLTLLVNTAVIGNYTTPNVGIVVPGILAKGVFNGQDVNLLPFFTGELSTTNVKDVASKVNFLDGGGALPLQMNLPANDTASNQYFLLLHLYQLFGSLLECSLQSSVTAFKPYSGDISMYSVHKFMNLNAAQVGYFIQQVGLSAASFGVSTEDVSYVGNALTTLFNTKCSRAVALTPQTTPDLQSVCTGDNCVVAKDSDSICLSNSTTPTTTTTTAKTPEQTTTKNNDKRNGFKWMTLLFLMILT